MLTKSLPPKVSSYHDMASRAQNGNSRRVTESKQILKAWDLNDSDKMSKGRNTKKCWSVEESEALRRFMEKESSCKWATVASHFPGRTAKQCRERWMNHLAPNRKKGNWSLEEDRIINSLQREFGNHWSKIAAHLPGRTDNDVKNRWYSSMRTLKRREAETSATSTRKSFKTSDNVIISHRTPLKSPSLDVMSLNSIESSDLGKSFPPMIVSGGYPSTETGKTTTGVEVDVVSSLIALKTKQSPVYDSGFHEENRRNKFSINDRSLLRQPPRQKRARRRVMARDIFSPSFLPHKSTTSDEWIYNVTPSSTIPLDTLPHCNSGPFFGRTHWLVKMTVHQSANMITDLIPSPVDLKKKNNVQSLFSPLPIFNLPSPIVELQAALNVN